MDLYMHICPPKFKYVRRFQTSQPIRILDIGCGNHSPSITRHWFPDCHYVGADVQQYNNTEEDIAAMEDFYLLSTDGTGYSSIPDSNYDFIILNHVIEHMPNATSTLAIICSKLKPGGYIWIAFPSLRSLSLPSAEGTLQFCDDPTHVYIPDIREVSNILLLNGVKILHAGRSSDIVRKLIGAVILPWRLLIRRVTGRLSAKGLWYVLGFEDHVLGQRRII